MGIRDTLNRQGKPVTALVVLVLLASIVAIVYYQSRSGDRFGAGSAFYTSDDGKSFFEANSSNIPPFTHDGKEAVQALVYTADGGKTRFVGYLMRFTPRGIQYLKESRAKAAASDRPTLPGFDSELQSNTEVKRPGDKTWVKLSDISRASEVMSIRSPTDPAKPADPVDP